MVTIKINDLEIEKVHGGYLVFLVTPREDTRCFLGQFSKDQLRSLAEGILEFVK